MSNFTIQTIKRTLTYLLKHFKRTRFSDDETTNKDDCNIFGENKKFDKLIVMDDVSGLADKSNDFSNFFKVSQKFDYICLYIFHIIYSTRSIWKMILSQTNIFNIFPSSIQLENILKIYQTIPTGKQSTTSRLEISG